MTASQRPDRFRRFLAGFSDLVNAGAPVELVLTSGAALMRELVAQDDWLPDSCARPSPERYQQYLLYCDGLERFSVVSFVWGPGQQTPIHDHGVWGIIGMLRGSEVSQSYATGEAGKIVADGPELRLRAGDVHVFSPGSGDIHRVWNADADRSAISIHIYGANIGARRRRTFSENGETKPFISGFSNDQIPNFWNRSNEVP